MFCILYVYMCMCGLCGCGWVMCRAGLIHLYNAHTFSFQDCCVYFIASGSVSVYRENAEGESVSGPDEVGTHSSCCMHH